MKYKQSVPNDKKMKCNMCGEYSLTHYEYKGTHIWLCDGKDMVDTDYTGCMNVQFENVEPKDLDNLIEFLKGGNQ